MISDDMKAGYGYCHIRDKLANRYYIASYKKVLLWGAGGERYG
ncbi:hypothetical protein QY97_03187 [Bacillus thermotolerans]|uniref:Uncharacterized protein n=1 Tax=Bacillus thermotolerans TaxID=1221996 RepID=A0A0F5HL68_BACTR|nr:hypothetical protein [Bacillus thermotolerans]KKB33567.1 hypothetical protein QY97_03187 [Bacillus thermotolerans]KKB35166.1 hypothetical protein QY95_03570 [Bacillus thermotolerans]KKB38146.1 hypothetical protein QY96_03108 [Bacillus thermotolerans]